MASGPPATRTCWHAAGHVVGALALTLVACTVQATAPCAKDSECPRGFRCVQALGVCRTVDPIPDAASGDSAVDAATDRDAGPGDRSADGPLLDQQALDQRVHDSSGADAVDAAAAVDAAMPDAGLDGSVADLVTVDITWPDVVEQDAAALSCHGWIACTPDPPVAGQLLEVHYYSTADLGPLVLHVAGPGQPQVQATYKFCDTNSTVCTYIFEVTGLQAGVLSMILTYSGGSRLAECAKLVVVGG